MMDRAQALVEKSPTRLASMVGISARLELVDRLRVDRTLAGQDFSPVRQWREIDQLTAFLAGSCIPIARNESTTDPTFQAFVAALPEWCQAWLADQYLVLPTNRDPRAAMQDWMVRAIPERCQLIAAHFAVVTLDYPSSVPFEPFDEHDREHARANAQDAPFEFGWIHPAGRGSLRDEVGVGLRTGLPEAEVLRFLLVVDLRQRLGAQDEATFADGYWTRRHVRTWMIRGRKELEGNVERIHFWGSRGLHPRPDHADFMPVAGLDDQAVRELLDHRHILLEVGVSAESFDGYVRRLDAINGRIVALNDRVDEPDFDLRNKAAEEESLLAALASEAETRALLVDLQRVHSQLNRALLADL